MSIKLGVVGDSIPLHVNNGYSTPTTIFVQKLAWLGAGDTGVTATDVSLASTSTADWLPTSTTQRSAYPFTTGAVATNLYNTSKATLVSAGVNLILLALGANDARIAAPAATYIANIKTIAAQLVADTGARVLVVQPYGFDTSRSGTVDAGYSAANLTLQKTYLPLMTTIDNGKTIRVGTSNIQSFIAANYGILDDGVHPAGPNGVNAVVWHWFQDLILRCPDLVLADLGNPIITLPLHVLRNAANVYDTTDLNQLVTVAILGGY